MSFIKTIGLHLHAQSSDRQRLVDSDTGTIAYTNIVIIVVMFLNDVNSCTVIL